MRSPYVQIRVSKEVADRIDELRHPTQSRNEWINYALLSRVIVHEYLLNKGHTQYKGKILDMDWVNEL